MAVYISEFLMMF